MIPKRISIRWNRQLPVLSVQVIVAVVATLDKNVETVNSYEIESFSDTHTERATVSSGILTPTSSLFT